MTTPAPLDVALAAARRLAAIPEMHPAVITIHPRWEDGRERVSCIDVSIPCGALMALAALCELLGCTTSSAHPFAFEDEALVSLRGRIGGVEVFAIAFQADARTLATPTVEAA